jgi:hypothetical protein
LLYSSPKKCEQQTAHVHFILQQFVFGERIEELFDPKKLKQYLFETDGIVLMPLNKPYILGSTSYFHRVLFRLCDFEFFSRKFTE